MSRLQAAPDRNLLKGNAELSRIVLDRFAANEQCAFVAEALVAELESQLDDDVLSLDVSRLAQSHPNGLGADLPAASNADRYPIRGTFFGCCA